MVCRLRILLLILGTSSLFLNHVNASVVIGQVDPVIEDGVSKKLAEYRKSILSDLRYSLDLDIPADHTKGIPAIESLSFQLKKNIYPLQIDFKEDPAKVKSMRVNGKYVKISFLNEHLVLAVKYLKVGKNEISFNFQAGDGALNRNADYLYTLFVPDRARTVFPCFDQPDLKAVYNLTLTIPSDWKAIANAPVKDTVDKVDRKTYHFMTSDLLSTYLFAFAAGKFQLAQNNLAGKKVDFLYRETDSAKLKSSIPDVYKIHENVLKYYENWTSIPYPFKKFGFVSIPDFQFAGMEHPGNIIYKASNLFLDDGATKNQLNIRSGIIAHETAHMWFGDLVTMNWFSDVWMKEVFANFMADKSMGDSISKDEYNLKFLFDHFPEAYDIDRTKGSNPIRQELDNLKDAGTLYGEIIYHKAPIMMRQLEHLMGEERFKLGVRQYLKEFASGNASWSDLIRILNSYSSTDLQSWNKVWVNETGRPIISYKIELKDSLISKFTISQKPEFGTNRIWPQFFELTFFYPTHSEVLTVSLNSADVVLKAAEGMEKPTFVLFNSSGIGYGLWPVDTAMLDKVSSIEKPVSRASAYISLYENMLNGRSIKPAVLMKLFLDALGKESEELNLSLLANYLSTIFWGFTTPSERERLAAPLEDILWKAIDQQVSANSKKILFSTYQNVFLTDKGRDRLYNIWKNQKAPEGIKLTEDNYSSLALALALRPGSNAAMLNEQLLRITNADRKKRFEFIMPAVSNEETVRDEFFKSLELKENRVKQPNVGAALYYLHHPLRQASSIKYLAKSLDMLSEIQRTGDVFFPQFWLQNTFGSYQDAAAIKVVNDFLTMHPNYNPKLRAKILQATDNLFRAGKLLN